MRVPDTASRWPAVAIWSLAALFPTTGASVWILRPDHQVWSARTFLRPSLPVDGNGSLNDAVRPFVRWNGEYRLAETPSSSETDVPTGDRRSSRSPGTGGCMPDAPLDWDAMPCFRRTLSTTGWKRCGRPIGQRHLDAITAIALLAAAFATFAALAALHYCRRRHSPDPDVR